MNQAQALVSLSNGVPSTTSIKVAETFGKRHTEVLRGIRFLSDNCPQTFSERNFASAEYTDEQGKPRPMYTMTRDGFTLLVMGYTGKEAMKFKIAYIEAFNAMEKQLAASHPAPELTSTSNAPLTPDQQCTLQALVKAKIEALPEDQRKGRGLYPQIWSRFNNHFRLARYCQLPQCRMSEAITYLTQLEIAPQAKALPEPEHAPQPTPKPETKFSIPALSKRCNLSSLCGHLDLLMQLVQLHGLQTNSTSYDKATTALVKSQNAHIIAAVNGLIIAKHAIKAAMNK